MHVTNITLRIIYTCIMDKIKLYLTRSVEKKSNKLSETQLNVEIIQAIINIDFMVKH